MNQAIRWVQRVVAYLYLDRVWEKCLTATPSAWARKPNELARTPMALRLNISLIAACCFVLTVFTFTASPVSAAQKPNIVFILADDLGWGELGCYGQQKIRTPNLDRLACEGMRFTQHYSGAPVCAPSRCVLMTGLHLGHAQIRGNRGVTKENGQPGEGQFPITADAMTIAEVLKQDGYATGAMGKWGLGPVESPGAPQRQGFDLFFGYNCQSVAHSYFPTHLWRNAERVVINAKPIPGHTKQPDGEVRIQDWQSEKYAPDLIVAEAIQFLKSNKAGPFFLYLPFIEPHVAMQPPPKLVESYPTEWDDKPYRGQCGYLPHPRPRAGYAAMITSLDEHVGKVLRTLDELNLSDDTLVVFSSDNGTTHESPGDKILGVGGVDGTFFNSTAGLRARKGSLHEGGIRVPMIVRWPGRVKPNSVSDFPCYFADHFPTLCAATGLETPQGLDGVSLLPTLTGSGQQAARNPMVWVFPEYSGQVAVRLGDFKIIRKNLNKKKAPDSWELYNIVKDREEKTDLAEQYPELIAQAIEILRDQMKSNTNFPVVVPGINDKSPTEE